MFPLRVLTLIIRVIHFQTTPFLNVLMQGVLCSISGAHIKGCLVEVLLSFGAMPDLYSCVEYVGPYSIYYYFYIAATYSAMLFTECMHSYHSLSQVCLTT